MSEDLPVFVSKDPKAKRSKDPHDKVLKTHIVWRMGVCGRATPSKIAFSAIVRTVECNELLRLMFLWLFEETFSR